MKRREFIGLIGNTALWPLAAQAQQSRKLPRIGYLVNSTTDNPLALAFFRGMSDLGYVDGKNIEIVTRVANSKLDLLPELAVELVSLKPDVLVATSAVGAFAAKKATSTIPTVAIGIHGGVRLGFYKSLAHPGGNFTGLDTWAEEIDAKRVAIMKEIFPQLS